MVKEIKEEKKTMLNEILIPVIIIIISVIFFNIIGSKFKYEKKDEGIKYYKAKILEAKTEKANAEIDLSNIPEEYREKALKMLDKDVENFKALILDEELKGKEVLGTKEIDGSYFSNFPKLKKGDNIIIVKSAIEGDNKFHFVSYNYFTKLIVVVLVFILSVILTAGVKGFKTISLLFLIGYAILKVYVPSIISGYNVYLVTLMLASFSIIVGMIIINGFNIKTYAAIVGNLIGIIIAGGLAAIVNKQFNITGASSEESMLLMRIDGFKFDLKGLAWSAMLIGALGAIMDTALSIASSIKEISKTNNTTSFKELFKSGMEVGKDAISTMISTLLLAYISGTLIQTILMNIYTKPLKFLLNSEFIVEEVIKAVIGAIGILITVPATAALASVFEVIENRKKIKKKTNIYNIDN